MLQKHWVRFEVQVDAHSVSDPRNFSVVPPMDRRKLLKAVPAVD